ncbi:MAG TPA: hypothetical protein VKZ53_06090 [Candidatus Angelobacter sp.]|nr:hypothetical protein [Candidatus Angelobacter sp.]
MRPKVSIFVLCSLERTGWVNPALCHALLYLGHDPRLDVSVEMIVDRRPVEHARNVCVCNARERGADLCIQIDNDMTLPANFADIVLEANRTRKAVVSLPAGIMPSGVPQIVPGDNGPKDGQFRETRYAGGGVLIISSEVWRVIPRGPWFRWVANDDEALSGKLGEDCYFCELVQKHGLTVWTHQSVAGHLKSADATHWILHLKRMERQLRDIQYKPGDMRPLEDLDPPIFVY